jgi:hypothetical protein
MAASTAEEELWRSDDEDLGGPPCARGEEGSISTEETVPTAASLLELTGEDRLEDIRELVLREHGLRDRSLAPLLGPLAQLEVLSLSNNCLRALSGWPPLSNLTTLNVNFNRLASLDPLTGCACLERLYAASNRVASVAALARLERLQTVSLFRNRLGSLDACIDVLAALPALDELDLGANPCATGPSYRHALVSSLPSVRTLDGEALSELDRELAAQYLDTLAHDAHEAATLFADVDDPNERASRASTGLAPPPHPPLAAKANGAQASTAPHALLAPRSPDSFAPCSSGPPAALRPAVLPCCDMSLCTSAAALISSSEPAASPPLISSSEPRASPL